MSRKRRVWWLLLAICPLAFLLYAFFGIPIPPASIVKEIQSGQSFVLRSPSPFYIVAHPKFESVQEESLLFEGFIEGPNPFLISEQISRDQYEEYKNNRLYSWHPQVRGAHVLSQSQDLDHPINRHQRYTLSYDESKFRVVLAVQDFRILRKRILGRPALRIENQ